MEREQLIAYIKAQLQNNVPEADIINTIKQSGWDENDYRELSAIARTQLQPTTPPPPPKPTPEPQTPSAEPQETPTLEPTVTNTPPTAQSTPATPTTPTTSETTQHNSGNKTMALVIFGTLLLIFGGLIYATSDNTPKGSLKDNIKISFSSNEEMTDDQQQEEQSAPKDPKETQRAPSTTLNQFVSALETCTPITFRRKTTTDVFGSLITTDAGFEITDGGKNCILAITVHSYTAAPSEEFIEFTTEREGGMSQAELDATYAELNTQSQILVGKSGICAIEASMIDYFTEALTDPTIGDAPFILFNDPTACAGELFTTIEELQF